jgi:sorting nexin-14
MENQEALTEGRRVLWTSAFLLVFSSSLLFIYFPFFVILLWIFSSGAFGAFLFFWYHERAPNVLIHLFPPLQEALKATTPTPLPPVTNLPRDNMWANENITLPENVNLAIEEFLEIALEKFVYKWERDLLKSEAVIDELRQGMQHIARVVTQRVHRLDVPTLLLKKMTKVFASHLHQYMSARMLNRRLSFEPMDQTLSRLTLNHSKCAVHWTLRGELTEQEYCKRVLSAVLPFVLPPEVIESKVVCSFLENLLIMKVALPAINFVAKPDIINKFLLLLVDRNSRMEKGFGPVPRPVVPLGTLAVRRHITHSPLALRQSDILQDQDLLYHFIQYLKEQGSVKLLHSFLALNGLLEKMLTLEEEGEEKQASILLQELVTWRQTNIQGIHVLSEEDTDVVELDKVLEECRHPLEAMNTVKSRGILMSIHNQLLAVLEQKYAAAYWQSDEYLSKPFGPRKATPVHKPSSLKQEKYLQRLIDKKKASSSPLIPQKSYLVDEPEQDTISDDVDILGNGSEDEEGKAQSSVNRLPLYVRIVDFESRTEGTLLSSYTVFLIVTHREDVRNGNEERGKLVSKVRRRYREFVALDDKLQQFYGNLGISLPPRRTVGNKNKEFLEKRSKQLQKYLMELVKNPKIRDNQLLQAFLTGSSAQFVPHSRAGKVLKSVPQMLKKEKGRNLDVYLKKFVSSTEHQPTNSSVVDGSLRESPLKREMERHQSTLEADRTRVNSGLYDIQDKMDTVPSVTGPYELLLFIARTFYTVPSYAMFLLSSFKFIGERTVNVVARRFVEERVEALTYDRNLIHLIHLLRDNVLLNPSSPRSVDEIAERQRMALQAVTDRPPAALIQLVGRDKHEWGMWMLFMSLQSHKLNKQLCYSLLDLIVMDLFPELDQIETSIEPN